MPLTPLVRVKDVLIAVFLVGDVRLHVISAVPDKVPLGRENRDGPAVHGGELPYLAYTHTRIQTFTRTIQNNLFFDAMFLTKKQKTLLPGTEGVELVEVALERKDVRDLCTTRQTASISDKCQNSVDNYFSDRSVSSSSHTTQ